MILTKEVYGSQFGRPEGPLPFDFRCGQIRSQEISHNGGWYNCLGEKLGFGDLAAADFLKVRAEIPADELFVVLPERASYWDFGMTATKETEDLDILAPGVNYVADKARYAIDDEYIYIVEDTWGPRAEILDSRFGGGKWLHISHTELKNLMVFCTDKLRKAALRVEPR